MYLFVGMDGWMGGWVDGWMGGWMDRWMDGWVDGWVDGWMDGRTGKQADGWMYRLMGGWLDGWVKDKVYIFNTNTISVLVADNIELQPFRGREVDSAKSFRLKDSNKVIENEYVVAPEEITGDVISSGSIVVAGQQSLARDSVTENIYQSDNELDQMEPLPAGMEGVVSVHRISCTMWDNRRWNCHSVNRKMYFL